MKKLLFAAVLLAALPWGAAAQVEKQVEVTKTYVPSVESAAKLAVEPDMTDTVRLRPEIDYTITPLSLRTTLATRPIRPATVTYWQFNRPLPCYLKIGAGYPSNSVLDFYASSQNPSTGYVVGYVNHTGRYADIRNDFDVKNKAWQMQNRVGAAAGKYLGRHMLEGEVAYDNRWYHRYGAYQAPDVTSAVRPGARIYFDDINADVRFGDDFQDLSRLNFEVALHGGLFMGNPEIFGLAASDGGQETHRLDGKSRQTAWGAEGRIARAFGRHRFLLDAGYDHLSGGKILDGKKQRRIHAGLRYGIDGGVVRFEAGADYYHDKVDGAESGNYLIPFLRMDFNLGTAGLKPFLELDGDVRDNSFRSLSQLNPYVANGLWLDKSSVDYNGRLGLGGSLWRDRFTYRVYAGLSIHDNHPYWYSFDERADNNEVLLSEGAFFASLARQTVTSLNGEIEYRPVSPLRITLGVHGYFYNDDAKSAVDPANTERYVLKNGAPSFEGNAGIRYDGRKIAFGVEIVMQGERAFTVCNRETDKEGIPLASGTFTVPFAADLRVDFDWKVSHRVTLFAEGRNLADRRLYEFPYYPGYGAGFTVGVKANF